MNASVNQNFNWYKGFDSSTGQYGSSNGSNSTNYSLNSSVLLFNGEKLSNKIKLAAIDLQSGLFYSEIGQRISRYKYSECLPSGLVCL